MKLAFVCGFVGFSLLGIALGANPFGYAAFLLSLCSLVGAIIWWVAGFKRTDPYSLGELRKVQDAEDRRAIEEQLMEIDSAGNAVCLNCGNHFDPMLNLCPRCGKSLFGC